MTKRDLKQLLPFIKTEEVQILRGRPRSHHRRPQRMRKAGSLWLNYVYYHYWGESRQSSKFILLMVGQEQIFCKRHIKSEKLRENGKFPPCPEESKGQMSYRERVSKDFVWDGAAGVSGEDAYLSLC